MLVGMSNDIESWFTTQQVAEHLGKSVFTVRDWAKAGIILGWKNGRDRMFKLSEVEAALTTKPADLWAQSSRSRNRRRT